MRITTERYCARHRGEHERGQQIGGSGNLRAAGPPGGGIPERVLGRRTSRIF
jgi:hypothetical protein